MIICTIYWTHTDYCRDLNSPIDEDGADEERDPGRDVDGTGEHPKQKQS